jgi:hypothetical protein
VDSDPGSSPESRRAMDALNWRKASYSASNGGGCVEVGGTPSAVLVRDTQDRTGPVLTFSAGAWRRFADQVKRSLATGPYPVSGRPGGAHPVVRVCPSACLAVSPRWPALPAAGCRRGGICFPPVPGSAWYRSRLWCAERVRAGGGPGSPGVCSFRRPEVAVRYAYLPCAARRPGHFPRSPAMVLLAISPVIRAAAQLRCCFALS